MKELSIEQKAKAYDEAIERAIEWSETKNGYYMPKELCKEIFPELKESEDEKIRKRLIFDFKVLGKTEWGGLEVKNIIAWLERQKVIDVLDEEEREFADNVDSYRKEIDAAYQKGYDEGYQKGYDKGVKVILEKQGEQKLADTDNKFIRMRETKPKDISEFLDRLTTVEQEFLWEHIAKIRELDKEEQKPTWSEEDETGLTNTIIMLKEGASLHFNKKDIAKAVDWLKSLRPQK